LTFDHNNNCNIGLNKRIQVSGIINENIDYKKSINLIKHKKHTMAKVNIKPIGDRVVIESSEAETKTASGLYIPDTAKEKPQHGKVVAVGAGKKDEPMTVKVGDKVLYGKYAGTEVTVDGKEYLIMREADIFAVV
jgi:chaperonin GroES